MPRNISHETSDELEVIDTTPTPKTPKQGSGPPRYWWVNQGRAYARQRQQNRLWASKQEPESEEALSHHQNVRHLQSGDVVFSYVSDHLLGIWTVTGEVGETVDAVGAGAWSAPAHWEDFEEPIPLDTIPLEWRSNIGDSGPFNRLGEVNQGYLYQLPAALGSWLLERFPRARSQRNYRIAVEEGLWETCLHTACIRVACDEVGDLRKYATVDELDTAIDTFCEASSAGLARQAAGLWTLKNLKPGDRIIASKGIDTVLAVGDVLEPGYEWREDYPRYRHTVTVAWDPSFAGPVTPQPSWSDAMIAPVTDTFVESLRQHSSTSQAGYSLDACALDTGLEREKLSRWLKAIDRKGQAILYGPPGTGKTFVAEKLAQVLSSREDGFTEIVQFHPSYSYEEFIQGIRPETQKDGRLHYRLAPGRFLEFCRKAEERTGLCVLIIDEINRAHLSRVFGELMYLLEYRDRKIPLAGGGDLSVPKNLRILGTMNTADRSIALVDHALRRRFAFLPLYPNFELLRQFHTGTGFSWKVDSLILVLERLNRLIDDRHFHLGVTFFLVDDLEDKLADIWQLEIEPYLAEIFFNRPNEVERFRWEQLSQEFGA